MIRARVFLGVAVCLLAVASATSDAAVLEEGAVIINPSTIQVGITSSTMPGDGTLRITPPSALTSKVLIVGQGQQPSRPQGKVFVEGAALTTDTATIGATSIGLLEVTLGGVFDAGKLTVGGMQSFAQQQAEGTIIVNGPGSRMRIGRSGLTIGEFGLGEMYLSNGAVISPLPLGLPGEPALIGNRAGSVGNVFIEGDSTLWHHAGEIVVGNLGTGSLHVTEGGNVISTGATVGDMTEGQVAAGLGNAIIDGLGSRWTTPFLVVGERGFGEVRVADGGLLNIANQATPQFPTTLGKQAGSFGRLIISGPDSRWVDSKQAVIGEQGTGELWIEDGALVSNAGAMIGSKSSTGAGRAIVRGEHTRWQAQSITVGGPFSDRPRFLTLEGFDAAIGEGVLEISDGATVAISGLSSTAFMINASGRVTLDHGTLAGNSQHNFTSTGLLEGHGLINVGTFTNSTNGRIVVGPGQLLKFSTTLNNNPMGRVEIMGGELETGRTFRNDKLSNVVAEDAVIRTRGGDGFVNFGGASLMGANRIYGKVNNPGTISVAGNSQATFYNDVRNDGSITASAGSTVRMLGAFQGKGVSGPGDVQLEGAVNPGSSPGTMEFGGDVTLGDLSTLNIEIAGTTPGTGFDQLIVSGDATLGGKLSLKALTALAAPTTLTILQAGDLFGEFSAVPSLGENLGFGVTFNGIDYDYAQDVVKVSLARSLAGDFNLDECVDGMDLLVWQRQLGGAADPAGSGGDANGDGMVDGADLESWRAAFATPSVGQAAVPEPGTVALILITLGLTRFWRESSVMRT